MDTNGKLLTAATKYFRHGWQPVYIEPGKKFPTIPGWQNKIVAETELPEIFSKPGNIGLLLGTPSGGLVNVDLDCKEALILADEFLPETSARSGRSGTPGAHRWYISTVDGIKQYRDPKTKKCILELRSTGGQTLVGPSIHPNGEIYADLDIDPPRVDPIVLTECVQNLYEEVVRQRYGVDLAPRTPPMPAPVLPAIELNSDPSTPAAPNPEDLKIIESRAIAYISAMPPAISGQGGHNATYSVATALVHGFCLPPDRALAILTEQYNPRCAPPWSPKQLEHKISEAVKNPHELPRGWIIAEPMDVNLDNFMVAKTSPEVSEPSPAPPESIPGIIPVEMLRIPGFISELMDHSLDTAPYPNSAMAFCGALALQAFLAGRKVRDPGDNRTNIYILGLAYSATGKDWPRKINTRIMHYIGAAGSIGEHFASGEGIQDKLFVSPNMLFQTDEIDGILQQIKNSTEVRYENIMNALLTLYSVSNSILPMRAKAGKSTTEVIDQPCMSIFGTAIPNHYYDALSSKMLTNGFLSRMTIVESGPRPVGQEPKILDIPWRILSAAKWWADFRPSAGNLADNHPIPKVISYSPDGLKAIVDARAEVDAEYSKAESVGDPVGTTVWGRVIEQARKLSLIYAVSENNERPIISAAAVAWAKKFSVMQAHRTLFQASAHVSDNPFHGMCLKFIEKLRADPNKKAAHQHMLKRSHLDIKTFNNVVTTLIQQGDIEIVSENQSGHGGRPKMFYKLVTYAVLPHASGEGREVC